MDFYEILKTRRCIREFKSNVIPDDVLMKIVDIARNSPSCSPPYEVSIIVIKDEVRRKDMVPLCMNQKFISDAPALLVVCAKNAKKNRGNYMADYGMLIDGAIVMDHITLIARAEGLATCWIGSFDNHKIKEFLSIPEDINVVALTPIGYPTNIDLFCLSKNKKKLEEIVHFEKW
ncbi:nitroreductase family protein [bacterium]|nr:nitroreductase family protein [bacterium]